MHEGDGPPKPTGHGGRHPEGRIKIAVAVVVSNVQDCSKAIAHGGPGNASSSGGPARGTARQHHREASAFGTTRGADEKVWIAIVVDVIECTKAGPESIHASPRPVESHHTTAVEWAGDGGDGPRTGAGLCGTGHQDGVAAAIRASVRR